MSVASLGLEYKTTITANGGVPPYVFDVKSGTLPAGLGLDATSGVLSGTPQAAGSFSFVIRVQDSQEPPASASKTFSLTVVDPGQVNVPVSADAVAQAAADLGLEPGLAVTYVRGDGLWAKGNLNWGEVHYDAAFGIDVLRGDLDATSLAIREDAARLLPKSTNPYDDLTTELEGWLWVDTAGDLDLEATNINDSFQLFFDGNEVLRLGPGDSGSKRDGTVPGVTRGFHRIRLVNYNYTYGFNFSVAMRESGQADLQMVSGQRLYFGPRVAELPLIEKSPVQGVPFSYQLRLQAGGTGATFAIVDGALPAGLSLASDGTLSGTPQEAGTHYFSVKVSNSSGLTTLRRLALQVIPGMPGETRNDSKDFFVSFDGSLADANGLSYSGAVNPNDGFLNLGLGNMGIKPYFKPTDPRGAWIQSGVGALGSNGCFAASGKEVGFYLTGQQYEHISDFYPAVRQSNRLAVMFKMPEDAIDGDGTEVKLSQDPTAYRTLILKNFHMAGHNVTRWAGATKEERNWHFYHILSAYWPDDWKPAFLRYVGNGWFYYEVGEQVGQQRTGGAADLSGLYDPMEDYQRDYYETMSRFYMKVNAPGSTPQDTYNTYPNGSTFYYDNLHMWRDANHVKVLGGQGERTVRRVLPNTATQVDVPFQVTYSGDHAVRFKLSRMHGSVPLFDGAGIYVDTNANGRVDAGEPTLEADRFTPPFSAGETKHFVYRIGLANVDADKVDEEGVALRIQDPRDVTSLDGDSLEILLFKTADPSVVVVSNLHPGLQLAAVAAPANQAPAVSITVAPATGVVGADLAFAGSAVDADGPKPLRPYWDFGDGSPLEFQETVTHRYAKPGTYVVRFYACDSVDRSVAQTTVQVQPN